MDRSEQLQLISTAIQNDQYGVARAVETVKTVFCRARSVSMSEHFAAGQAGFRASMQFTVLAAEYAGEPVVCYRGQRFGVYRTYTSSKDTLELYGEVKAGV